MTRPSDPSEAAIDEKNWARLRIAATMFLFAGSLLGIFGLLGWEIPAIIAFFAGVTAWFVGMIFFLSLWLSAFRHSVDLLLSLIAKLANLFLRK